MGRGRNRNILVGCTYEQIGCGVVILLLDTILNKMLKININSQNITDHHSHCFCIYSLELALIGVARKRL